MLAITTHPPSYAGVTCIKFTISVLSSSAVMGRDSPSYRLDGPGIESPWRRKFSAPVQTCPGAHPASCTMHTGSLSRGVKRPGRGVDHVPPSRNEVKERKELYIYSPLWTFVTCSGVSLTFTVTFFFNLIYYTDNIYKILYI